MQLFKLFITELAKILIWNIIDWIEIVNALFTK